jgi:hypothetical protein
MSCTSTIAAGVGGRVRGRSRVGVGSMVRVRVRVRVGGQAVKNTSLVSLPVMHFPSWFFKCPFLCNPRMKGRLAAFCVGTIL